MLNVDYINTRQYFDSIQKYMKVFESILAHILYIGYYLKIITVPITRCWAFTEPAPVHTWIFCTFFLVLLIGLSKCSWSITEFFCPHDSSPLIKYMNEYKLWHKIRTKVMNILYFIHVRKMQIFIENHKLLIFLKIL